MWSSGDILRRSPSRRLIGVALAGVAVVAVLLLVARPSGASRARAASTCAGAGTPIAATTHARSRATLLCMINQQRSAHHLPQLNRSSRLQTAAQQWTAAMVAHSKLSHSPLIASRITATGYRWHFLGEDIGTGLATPNDVIVSWMANRAHCQTILDPHLGDAGVGVSSRSAGANTSADGTWTVDYGLLQGAPMPSRNGGPARGCPYTLPPAP